MQAIVNVIVKINAEQKLPYAQPQRLLYVSVRLGVFVWDYNNFAGIAWSQGDTRNNDVALTAWLLTNNFEDVKLFHVKLRVGIDNDLFSDGTLEVGNERIFLAK